MTRSIPSGARTVRVAVTALLLALLCVVVLANAWLSEDAYITFRVVDNFADGHGLRWNVDERVQPYTHPLWLLVLLGAHAFTRELYLTPVAASLLCTLGAAVLLCLRIAWTVRGAVLATLLLVGSKAFVDYSTSGLENALSHLLLAAALAAHFRAATPRRVAWLSFFCGLAVLNRMDIALLILPLLAGAASATASLRSFVRTVVFGFLPFLLWEVFSLVYYGFPFPNSAYAKLQNGIPQSVLVQHGIHYLWNSLRLDPITLPTIGLAGGLAATVRLPGAKAPIVGVLLYLLYVVSIGGDFMSGRFLTAPLLVACAVVARTTWSNRWLWSVACLACLTVSLASPLSPLRFRRDYGRDGLDDHAKIDAAGIADERAYYFQYTGPWRAGAAGAWPNHPWMWDGVRGRESGYTVLPVSHVGFYGYAAGPTLHVVDLLGLADPLLARLPPRTDRPWRIGHFERIPPAGYVESLADPTFANRIADPRIATLYDDLHLITRGGIFDAARWTAIWRVNIAHHSGERSAAVSSIGKSAIRNETTK